MIDLFKKCFFAVRNYIHSNRILVLKNKIQTHESMHRCHMSFDFFTHFIMFCCMYIPKYKMCAMHIHLTNVKTIHA